MPESETSSSSPEPRSHASDAAPAADPPRSTLLGEVIGLVVLGLLVAVPLRGHFVKPHSDFFQFAETGRSLLAGELPASLKRAPLYPLLVAGGGAAVRALLPVELPEVLAAQWLGVLLLPLNGVLVLMLARQWSPKLAPWVSAWFLVLPWGVYCTVHTIAEPLLVTTILLTVLAARRGGWRAYVWAALATLTRFDAAGLLLGVALAERMRGKPWRSIVLHAGLAALPMAVWLALTAVTWADRSEDHYLSQIVEAPAFAAPWALRVVLDVVFAPDRLRLPSWAQDWEASLLLVVRVGLVLSATAGALALVWRRDRAAVVAAVFFVTYTLVHAAFPFREIRFGYPPAALLLLAAGAALQAALVDWKLPGRIPRWLPNLVLGASGAVVLLLLFGELGGLALTPANRPAWGAALLVLWVIGGVASWVALELPDRRALRRLVAAGAGLLLLSVQLRTALPLLGNGREMVNVVEAARWVHANRVLGQRVLSGSPGLLRLFEEPRARADFLGFQDIAAQSWPDVLAELRARGIGLIIWHDQMFAEHGGYYSEKWRLERFRGLDQPELLAGVRVERYFAGEPAAWVLRVLSADAPAATQQGGAGPGSPVPPRSN